MEELSGAQNIRYFLAIASRRKWYIVIPLVAAVFLSYGVYHYLPKIYKATTVILVQPQRVPEAYVRSTITETVSTRLATISQEILSRTRLEKVIQEFNLYSEYREKASMEEVIEIMKKAVIIEIGGKFRDARDERNQNTFALSYEGKEPRIVMLVTNKLASLFIEENLKAREIQAEGTSEFISKELVAMEAQLKKQDQTIRSYRERNMGNLPSQLDANLRILERLHEQLRTTNEAIKTSEDRAFLIQEQIEKLKRDLTVPVKTPGARKEQGQDEESIQEHPLSTQLDNLRRELEIAQSKYTETHPDIIDMKKKIGVLEIKLNIALKELEAKKIARQKELKARQDRAKVTAEDLSETIIDPTVQGTLEKYTNQLNEVQIEAKRIRGEAKNIKEQIAIYQKRIEDTPKKEEELALLTRDYDLLMKNYQSLSDKRIQSRMAENLERRQQGEQFKILDPAQLPEIPIKPDFAKTMAMGAVFGLFAGIGLVWFRETWNQKFHNEADVESYLRIPVIAVIPNLKEDKG